MTQENITADPKDVQDNKVMAILAYFGLLFLIPLFAAKESPFARFHTNQGLILCITWIVAMIIVAILGTILMFISPILSFIPYLIMFVFPILGIIGIINAAKGEMKELPIIGKYRIIK